MGRGKDEPVASRRELDQLRARVEQMDEHGTRGVGAIAAQVTELVKDQLELKADMRVWQGAHDQLHAQETRDRTSARRFALTTTVAIIALLLTVIGLLLVHR